MKKFLKRIPKLPLSALIFYLFVTLLWNLNLIPPPTEILFFLEFLYDNYGLFGLGLASFLEGIVYLGLYFPGSFIIVISVFLSNGSFISLFLISLVVAIAITLTSFVNYFLGRRISSKKKTHQKIRQHKKLSKSFILSLLHPNILAFYFFNSGLERKNFRKIFLVPIFMIPYGLFHAYLLFALSGFVKQRIDNSWVIFIIIMIWIVIAFIIEYKRKIKKELEILSLDIYNTKPLKTYFSLNSNGRYCERDKKQC